MIRKFILKNGIGYELNWVVEFWPWRHHVENLKIGCMPCLLYTRFSLPLCSLSYLFSPSLLCTTAPPPNRDKLSARQVCNHLLLLSAVCFIGVFFAFFSLFSSLPLYFTLPLLISSFLFHFIYYYTFSVFIYFASFFKFYFSVLILALFMFISIFCF